VIAASGGDQFARCEVLAQQLGRKGAFTEMTYRLFPETRNSFAPDLSELGFDYREIRLVNRGADLRFQIFPADLVVPLRKQLEDLRHELRAMDDGPLPYTGAAFLSHDNLLAFRARAEDVRREIQSTLRRELVDNYDDVRRRAREELQLTVETLLPRLGVENLDEILDSPSWFQAVFPPQSQISGDLKLWIHVYNVHPLALVEYPSLRSAVTRLVNRPQQLSLF
jgi:hypothetical protein